MIRSPARQAPAKRGGIALERSPRALRSRPADGGRPSFDQCARDCGTLSTLSSTCASDRPSGQTSEQGAPAALMNDLARARSAPGSWHCRAAWSRLQRWQYSFSRRASAALPATSGLELGTRSKACSAAFGRATQFPASSFAPEPVPSGSVGSRCGRGVTALHCGALAIICPRESARPRVRAGCVTSDTPLTTRTVTRAHAMERATRYWAAVPALGLLHLVRGQAGPLRRLSRSIDPQALRAAHVA